MLNDFSGADKVYIACGYTDLRRGIGGLTWMVQQEYERNHFTNMPLLFSGSEEIESMLYWKRLS